ncbi:hypothetical protein [Methylovorus glucosotrophus]|uniref:hypothetical protein n=1 Tax=Methylovorus glucosotrophus TaxID=266009 RepID=UPI00059BB5B1|nr:hypothetical protein [Methylovorus glucosotrophus]
MTRKSLIEVLNVSMADLMPSKGIAIVLAGDSLPLRISERLHQAIREIAAHTGQTISEVASSLRDEINAEEQL